jgi:hypothetical protein
LYVECQWNDDWQEKSKFLVKHFSVPFYLLQILHELPWDCTWLFLVRHRLMTSFVWHYQSHLKCGVMNLSCVQVTQHKLRQHNIMAHLRNLCYCQKAICTTYAQCVSVALVFQHAKRMCCIMMSYTSCLDLPYFFFTLSHERYDFREINYWICNACLNFVSIRVVWNISDSKNNSARYYHKCTLVFV